MANLIKIPALLAFAALAVPLPAQALPSQVLGEGAATCRDFMNEPNMQSVRLEWVLGYISGENSQAFQGRMTGRTLHDERTPLAWLQNYCAANLTHPLIVAAETLRIDLAAHEQQ